MLDDLLTGNWSQHQTQSYYTEDYGQAGFNSFLSRSIDVSGRVAADPLLSTPQAVAPKSINYDFSQTSGSLGDIIKIGSINLDGRRGRISFIDEYGNEALILGNLDS